MAKQPRGSRGARKGAAPPGGRLHHDLFVPLPPIKSSEQKVQSRLMVRNMGQRLAATGYSTMALTHTVFGSPKAGQDEAIQAIPSSIYEAPTAPKPSKRQKVANEKETSKFPVRVLRRLQVVVENLSDVALYSDSTTGANSTNNEKTTVERITREYDLISLSPRSDATFQAACRDASVDIVTLDYTSGRGGVQLPYRIRPPDVKAAVQRGTAFEIPYAPGILNVPQRKALVQAAKALQLASIGVRPRPRLLLSSGDRSSGVVATESDAGAFALRSPDDLINVLQTVLGFDDNTSRGALGASGTAILQRAELRRKGHLQGNNARVVIQVDDGTQGDAPTLGDMALSLNKTVETEPKHDDEAAIEEDEGLGDGFISMS